ncbi:SixA phosphatase family protein [Roseicella aquatilis]|uniref:Histidine phosphatase family protein n=1 Tax=Roseicella aquatilis TaxID=2527868 RepID=A0A4R4D7E6_9PROT|nr:histidine phosphatase family protein [Roseicella aquatilis]TCZ56264.1 histidine phosphatase family protein [Roseicella aquatilis]
MRQLLLLRHAKSSWDDPALSDHARPLNARGRRAAAAIAATMRELGLSPDIVLVSSARRTLQTLEALTPFEDAALVEPMDALYLAPWRNILAAIREVPETARSLLVIGHNPGLHELALALAGAEGIIRGGPMVQRLADAYPTGALAEFTIASPWHLLEPGGGRLVRFIQPRDLLAADPAETLP